MSEQGLVSWELCWLRGLNANISSASFVVSEPACPVALPGQGLGICILGATVA